MRLERPARKATKARYENPSRRFLCHRALRAISDLCVLCQSIDELGIETIICVTSLLVQESGLHQKQA